VILVDLGMKIPVDGICLEANELKCDESAMTGESDHLKKDTVEVCLKKIEEL
jgi:magnesium-transporting ATPase (P-type)